MLYNNRNVQHYNYNEDNKKIKISKLKKIYLENSLQHNNFLLENNYIHELGHILMLRNKGSVFNYLHHEFIPISLELLYSYINNSEDGLNLIIAEIK